MLSLPMNNMEQLGIEPKLLLAQIVNFSIFFLIFQRFMAKPFIAFIKKERKNEEERQKALEQITTQEQRLAEEEKEFKQKMRKAIDEEIKKAKEQGVAVREDIVAQAHKEAEGIVAQARKQIEDERASMYRDAKTKIGNLSVTIVDKALKDYLTEDAQKRITQHIVQNLTKDVQYE